MGGRLGLGADEKRAAVERPGRVHSRGAEAHATAVEHQSRALYRVELPEGYPRQRRLSQSVRPRLPIFHQRLGC